MTKFASEPTRYELPIIPKSHFGYKSKVRFPVVINGKTVWLTRLAFDRYRRKKARACRSN